MLKIREFTNDAGTLSAVFLRSSRGDDGDDDARGDNASAALEIGVDDEPLVGLPAGALEAVMTRYGAPFDPDAPVSVVDRLSLGGGRTLRHVRHLAGYDVIARDYLVYDDARAGAESLCALATTVATALEHLARAVRARAAG